MAGGGQGGASQDFLRDLAAYLPDYVVLVDRQRRYRWTNRVANTLTLEQVLASRVDDFIAPADLPAAIEAIERCFATGEHANYMATAYGDGVESYCYENRVVPAPAAPDGPRVLILTRDVTRQVKAEHELKRSEERYRALLESSPDYILGIDAARCVRYANRTHPSLTMSEVIGSRVERFIPADAREAALTAIEAALEARTAGAWSSNSDVAGPERFAVRILPVEGPDDIRALILVEDVSELYRLEQRRSALQHQLEHAQRLESVGQLAGGIAHDFNNLLTVILSGVSLVRESLRARDDASEDLADLADVVSAAERAAGVTQQLLAFSRHATLQVTTLDIAQLVDDVVRLAKRVIPASIEVVFERDATPVWVHGDPGQLEQVLLNLCLNARDAMPDGGRLAITVQPRSEHVQIQVCDTGAGIDPAILPRIFEPFFTTKAAGSGSGLGLAMAHGIVEQHRGRIEVESQPGVGTTVALHLPLEAPPAAVGQAAEEDAPRGRGRVLLADDEPLVLKLAERTLLAAGYEVVVARDGVEALERFVEGGSNFDLVVLDAVMPRLNGWNTFERMRALAPDVRVLFCSGYLAGSIPGQLGHAAGRPDLLSKPFKPPDLLRAVAEALAPNDPPAPTAAEPASDD